MLCFSNFASLAKSLKAQETLCIRMLYHRRVWLWLNCSSLAQWFELSCTGTLFCSVLPLMLLRCGTSVDFVVLFSQIVGLGGIQSLVNSCTEWLMSLFRHGDSSLFPVWMQISFGISQGGVSTHHAGREALFTVPLCLCNWFWLSLAVYLLNPSVLCWFECLHCWTCCQQHQVCGVCGASGPQESS